MNGTAILVGLGILLPNASSAWAVPRTPSPAFSLPASGERTDVIAHRGASAYAPENTLAAVTEADRLGALWVENDVQRTSDGHLVVIHDTTLSRTTDVEKRFPDRAPWNVRDFTLGEIERLDAGGWFDPVYAGERIPTLEQYLRLVNRTGQRLLLEVKAPELYPGIERQILRVLRRHGWLGPWHVRRMLVVQSFSARSITTVHALDPRVRTGFLGTPRVGDLRTYARFADQINPPRRNVTAEYVAAVHRVTGAHGRPLEVSTWTVNAPDAARRAVHAGVDGIITNRPDTVRDAVRRED